MTKTSARIIAKQKLMSIDNSTKDKRSQDIIEQITSLEAFKRAKTIALYYPLDLEVNLLELLNYDKIFCFPKINKDNQLEFIYVDKKTMWLKNRFNINEPKDGKIVTSRIDLMLIPSLARNNNRTRLGYGGGYYDKYLAKNDVNKKIGILLNDNILEFTTDKFDINMDLYLTSKE